MILSYKFRVYPTRAQSALLSDLLADFCELYNAGLQQRIEAYERRSVSLSYATQTSELKAIRAEHAGLARWSFTAEQQVLRRLDKSFKGFFGRVRRGAKVGFPRFRSVGRYRTADFRIGDGLTLRQSGRVGIVGIPNEIKVKWHRPLPAKPKSAVLTRRNGKWFIVFYVDVDVASTRNGEMVGIDAGLTSIVALSNGETVKRTNLTKRAAKELRRRQRALARCKAGSKRRAKAKLHLAKFSEKISARRRDLLHKVSCGLVGRFSDIAVENLNIKGLASSMLAKEVNDAAWAQLILMLGYKAEKAGGRLVKVDPRGTSQTCPECGTVKAKTLAERRHRCDCGCDLDRDVAAAIVIHQRAFGHGTCLQSQSQRNAA